MLPSGIYQVFRVLHYAAMTRVIQYVDLTQVLLQPDYSVDDQISIEFLCWCLVAASLGILTKAVNHKKNSRVISIYMMS